MKREKFLIFILLVGLVITLTFSSAIAEQFLVFRKPLNLFGYVTQGGSISLMDK